MEQPKIERMLRLLKLLTANNRYTISDLANRLQTSDRTIYRYIDSFREAGFVIKKQGDITRIDKSSPYFKDICQLVHFTEEEAYILKSAIENIDENKKETPFFKAIKDVNIEIREYDKNIDFNKNVKKKIRY